MIPKSRPHSTFKTLFLVLAVTFAGTFCALIWVRFIPDNIHSSVNPVKFKKTFSSGHETEEKVNNDDQRTDKKIEDRKTEEEANEKHKTENEFDADTEEHMKAFPRLYAKSLKSPLYEKEFPNIKSDPEKQAAIKEAFLHGYRHYSNKCWGSDEYLPLSDSCGDSIHGGLTIIDSLSTIIIMNLQDEYKKAKEYILNDFAINGGWSLFEFIIRILGGLLSAAELTGDKDLIKKSISVGEGVWSEVDRNNGFYNSLCRFNTNRNEADHSLDSYSISCSGGGYCLAEVGTFQLEFYVLSRLSGDPKFIKTGLKVYDQLWKSNPKQGLISSHLGAGTDSYYEYITKGYVMTGGISDEMLHRHLLLMKDIRNQLLFKTANKNLVGHGIKSGSQPDPMIEHLATFVGGMVAVGSVEKNPEHIEDLKLAGQFADTYAETYNHFKSGIMPEQVKYNVNNKDEKSDFKMVVDGYILRPETVESIYYLWKFTGLQKYRDYNWRIFKAINKSCRVENGFTSISNLDSEEPSHSNKMESFFFAETLKYLYLTFSDSHLISPAEWVFNTEAHPLRVWDQKTIEKYKNLFEFENIKKLSKE
ncbi:hypothetical protein M9Y10_021562 [Tritrichomonas musculus]|uniref:alpha-1,2-Mannosidase n=1 Tax=Tritrichomonas musculus TaxID=1915356 RepID=A0ABR2KRW5_9EUKA